jgi:NitT/TauT family transport system substrate-binding protein
MKLSTIARAVAVAALLATTAAPGAAAPAPQKVTMILNWIAGGDHAPYYYAQKMGWYKDAGIDLTLEQGKGSTLAAQRVGAGVDALGLADMATVMTAKASGANEVAVMNVYANFPEGFYWMKNAEPGIKTLKDFEGKKVGNPPGDAGRVLWKALAKINHLNPDGITWVNVQPNAKLGALEGHAVDAVTEFYNFHYNYVKTLGPNMGYIAWKDYGMNPYGNSIVVNGDYLKSHKDVVAAFVRVTQRAFAACAATPTPCINALVEANSGLNVGNETQNWREVVQLLDDRDFKNTALGWFNPQRMESTYQIYSTALGFAKPFDVKSVYTDAFLDKSIKLPANAASK